MDIKEKLIAKCRALTMETIANLEAEINEAQKAANEYGMPKDRYDSFRSQLLRKRDMFSQQLLKAKEQLTLLDRIDAAKKLSRVGFGALVMSENQNLFVSVGLGKIEVDGDIYFAISPAVPIYKAMEGKKKGEEFEFNGRRNKILDVY